MAMAKYDGHWPVTTQSRVQFPAAPEFLSFFQLFLGSELDISINFR